MGWRDKKGLLIESCRADDRDFLSLLGLESWEKVPGHGMTAQGSLAVLVL